MQWACLSLADIAREAGAALGSGRGQGAGVEEEDVVEVAIPEGINPQVFAVKGGILEHVAKKYRIRVQVNTEMSLQFRR